MQLGGWLHQRYAPNRQGSRVARATSGPVPIHHSEHLFHLKSYSALYPRFTVNRGLLASLYFNFLAPQAALRRATSRQHYLGTISAPGWSPARAWDPYQPQLPSRPTCASCHTAPIQHVYERSVVVIIAWSRVLQTA